jgi:ketosteroid isomerase-like protein
MTYQLPDAIAHYQQAHDRHDIDAAVVAFTPDARVVDDDREYRGTDEIRRWLATAATEYHYTRTLLDIQAADEDSWIVVNRLEGDFPGGVVDLRYCFALRDDLIADLVIAP